MENNGFTIVTESNSDLPLDFCTKNGIGMMRLQFIMDGKNYWSYDDAMPVKEFYDKMRAGGMPQTVQVNPDQARQCFEDNLKQGKDVLCLSFSSALSGCYSSYVIARDELAELYPDRKIIVVDTLSASLGEGLIIYYANEMKKEGKSIDEVAAWVEENKLTFCHYFTVEDLNHLYRGGRVSKATAIVGSVLGIKPLLHVDDEGRLISIGKVRGRKQSLTKLVDYMESKIEKAKNKIIMISHGDCLEEANYVRDLVKERTGIKEFLIAPVGATVGAHSGPGTMALFFIGKSRKENH